MRTIKFRGKRITDNQWVYGGIAISPVGEVIILTKEEQVVWNVIPETVGQFWKRSMKEFYGGDLFKAMSSVSGSKKKKIHLCKVVDSESGMDVVVWHEGEWWGYSYMNFCDIERVGNIHDNAELLSSF